VPESPAESQTTSGPFDHLSIPSKSAGADGVTSAPWDERGPRKMEPEARKATLAGGGQVWPGSVRMRTGFGGVFTNPWSSIESLSSGLREIDAGDPPAIRAFFARFGEVFVSSDPLCFDTGWTSQIRDEPSPSRFNLVPILIPAHLLSL